MSDNNWLLLAPYGDHPHTQGLQRLTREDAQNMVARHRSVLGKIRRAFGGVPIYIGHPDEPSLRGTPGHGDTKAYGWIHDLAARDDGLWVSPKWSSFGKTLIENAYYKFFSPRWKLRRGDDDALHPIELVSVGLTNTPNIDSDAIAADPKPSANSAPNPELAEIAKAVGLPANAALPELVEAVQNFASERLARIEALLDLAETNGKISANERDSWQKKLREDFPAASNSLMSHGEFLSDTLCNSESDFLTLVQARCASTGESFLDAWNALKASHRADFDRIKSF